MKSYYKRRSLLLLLLFTSLYSFAAPVKGKVTDAFTGEPLVGAVIKLVNTRYSAIVKLDGSYNFPNIPSGNYTVRISYTGYKVTERNVSVSSNNDIQLLDLIVEPLVNTLSSVTVTAKGFN